MRPAPPKLRSDLIRSQQTVADGVVYVFKDPVAGSYYRLREAEGFIAEQLDGVATLTDIRVRVEQRFGATVGEDELSIFVKTLDRNGLLQTERSARKMQGDKPTKHIVGGLLYARIRLFDPGRLLDFLIRHTGFFYTRRFVWLSALVIALAGVVTLGNLHDISRDAARFYGIATLPLLVATIFFTGSAHELSHGLTCRHYGGEVRDMGFMLLYFQPALYCNVSDAWLFPEKSKRLWVGFAGPWFELFLGAVATLLWRVTEPDTGINHISLLVMGASGFKTIINFNPLIKLDGYYLLSDWLEIPNLRRRSYAYVGDLLRRLSGSLRKLPELPRRERRIFLLYGLTAVGGSVLFFSIGVVTISRYLIQHEQPAMLLGFVGLVIARYRQYLIRLFPHRKSAGGRGGAGGLARFRPSRPLLTKLGAGAAALLLLFFGHMDLTVSGPINVLPYHNNDVRTEIAGLVAAVYVHEGQHVHKGDLVARLDDDDLRNQLAQTQSGIAQQRAALAQLVAGPTPDEVKVARGAVSDAKDQLAFAQTNLGRSETLYQHALIPRAQYDTARQAETTATDALSDAESKLRVLLDGSRPETIAAARAKLAGLLAQQSYLQTELSEVNVPSPSDGVVTTPTRELDSLIHQSIPEGGLIAKVYDVKVITVEVEVPETEIADVAVGQSVAIKTRAYPDRDFRGRVVEIGTTTSASPAVSLSGTSSQPAVATASRAGTAPVSIRVITEIDNQDGLLKPGMTGIAKIEGGKRRIINLITRRLSRTVRVDLWSWW